MVELSFGGLDLHSLRSSGNKIYPGLPFRPAGFSGLALFTDWVVPSPFWVPFAM